MARRRKRRIGANLRYLFALLSRFKFTVAVALLLFGVAPWLYRALYVGPGGERIDLGAAFHQVYFLLFGQPSLPYVSSVPVEAMNLIIPPLGIAVVIDGIVRFAFLYFAKHRSDKEWIAVISKTLRDHVIVCGAGRVGYRVVTELLALGREVVVIERNEEGQFVQVLRDEGVPVLIDDVKSPQCLSRSNVSAAASIVCATDDDLANLNAALDARRLNPEIRLVIRLFDDDLVAKVRDTFKAEALSSSALAAPAMALAALDPRIVHSFHISGRLMVVSQFVARQGLTELSVGQVQERFRTLVLAVKAGGGPERFHPGAESKISAQDVLTVQAAYDDYLKLRAFTGEERPPLGLVS